MGLIGTKPCSFLPLLRIRAHARGVWSGVDRTRRTRHCCRHSGVACLIYSRVSVRYLGCCPPLRSSYFSPRCLSELITDNVGLGSSKIPLLIQTGDISGIFENQIELPATLSIRDCAIRRFCRKKRYRIAEEHAESRFKVVLPT